MKRSSMGSLRRSALLSAMACHRVGGIFAAFEVDFRRLMRFAAPQTAGRFRLNKALFPLSPHTSEPIPTIC